MLVLHARGLNRVSVALSAGHALLIVVLLCVLVYSGNTCVDENSVGTAVCTLHNVTLRMLLLLA
jgi:hypothetical protein